MFAALYTEDLSAIETLVAVVRDFTPRFEVMHRHVVLDLSGLGRLFGSEALIAGALHRAAAGRGAHASTAVAPTCTAARLLAIAGRRRVRPAAPLVIEPGAAAAALAPLPIDLLTVLAADDSAPPRHRTIAPAHLFRRWGIQTLGALAALPVDAIAARLGADGVRWHRLARGEDLRPLTPETPEERFEQAIDLEWPIEGLEPLAFVLGRLLEPLAAHLERRGRGAAILHLRLKLITRVVYERSLQLPAPMRDARTLRTLLLLDLESHPPPAGIDRVEISVDPTPARVLQFSLLARPLPSPEQLSALTARLAALMGEGRCGSPAVADTWRPGAFVMKRFMPGPVLPEAQGLQRETQSPTPEALRLGLRRFRAPVPARVRLERDVPVVVTTYRREVPGGHVRHVAGPWRTSGDWWAKPWDRDEWDVTLSDGITCRIVLDRSTAAWFVEGVYD